MPVPCLLAAVTPCVVRIARNFPRRHYKNRPSAAESERHEKDNETHLTEKALQEGQSRFLGKAYSGAAELNGNKALGRAREGPKILVATSTGKEGMAGPVESLLTAASDAAGSQRPCFALRSIPSGMFDRTVHACSRFS